MSAKRRAGGRRASTTRVWMDGQRGPTLADAGGGGWVLGEGVLAAGWHSFWGQGLLRARRSNESPLTYCMTPAARSARGVRRPLFL